MPTVAIAGTGFMAGIHAERYREMDVDVAAVSSRTDPAPFIEARDLDATAYTDTAEMLAAEDVDFVDICTPTDTHEDVVTSAADADLDVFLEKPIAGSLAEARAVADAVDDAGITCMVGHVLRYFPQYVQAKARYDNGGIGDPGVARARRLSPFPDWGTDNWYADRDRSGGVFLDLAIHDLDYLRWLWGDVARVFARQKVGPRWEHGFVTVRFESGAVGYVEASWAQPDSRELTAELELAGDDGLIELTTENDASYRTFDDDGVTAESPVARDGYRRELEHFVQCLETGREPDVGVDDAIDTLRLSLAARLSAERGEPVAPAEVDA